MLSGPVVLHAWCQNKLCHHVERLYSKLCNKLKDKDKSIWVAIKTRQDFRAAELLKSLCEDVFFPTHEVVTSTKATRRRAVIPHVLFVKTTYKAILELESQGRANPAQSVPFWIYRYPKDNEIQVIPQAQIDLLKLVTSEDTTGCEIFRNTDFKANEYVRITGGIYKGYSGYVKRVHKNKHVIVRIEGVCLVMLPYIHPDLLEKIDVIN